MRGTLNRLKLTCGTVRNHLRAKVDSSVYCLDVSDSMGERTKLPADWALPLPLFAALLDAFDILVVLALEALSAEDKLTIALG